MTGIREINKNNPTQTFHLQNHLSEKAGGKNYRITFGPTAKESFCNINNINQINSTSKQVKVEC